MNVCFDVHWPLGSGERNGLTLGDGPGRHRGHSQGCDFVEIDGTELERDGIQPGDAKELLDEPVHTRDIGPQFLELAVSIHRFESRVDDRERRAKLMGGVGGELALHGEALLEPIERMVDGSHQRHDFRRQILFRQPYRRRIGTDRCGHPRNLAHGFESVADCKDANCQCGQHEQRAHPNGIDYEFSQNRPNESVRSFGPRDRYPHRTRGRLQRDAQAVVGLGAKILGPSATEAEIARLIRGRRPFGHPLAKLIGGRGNDAAIGIADREQVIFGCRRVGGSKLRRQIEARLAGTVGDKGPREILGAQAEFAVIQRSRRVVDLINQNADRDRSGGDIQHRKAHREAHLQRAKLAETHPFVSASK